MPPSASPGPLRSLPAALLALLALLALAGTAGAQDPPRTLDELLRRARAQEEQVLARLADPVRVLVSALETKEGDDLEAARKELEGLGRAAAPLLLDALDPGKDPEAPAARRAAAVAATLRAWGAPGVEDGLVARCRGGTPAARAVAIGVLPRIADADRARAVLVEVLADGSPVVRAAAVRALGELAAGGDEESLPPLRALLAKAPKELAGLALEALADAGDAGAEPEVRALAGDPGRLEDLLDGVVSYYRAVPAAPRDEVARALVAAAAAPKLPLARRRRILEGVARIGPELDRDLRSAFEPLTGSSDPQVSEEGLICLTLLGDRGAKRDVQRRYDDWVKKQDSWASAYEARAAMEERIREYGDAAKDWTRAIELRKARQGNVPRELYVELARSYVLDGKLRQASEAVESGYFSNDQLAALRADPDFRPLLEHARYGRVLQGS